MSQLRFDVELKLFHSNILTANILIHTEIHVKSGKDNVFVNQGSPVWLQQGPFSWIMFL